MARKKSAKTGGAGKALAILQNKDKKKVSAAAAKKAQHDHESDGSDSDEGYFDDRGNMRFEKKSKEEEEDEDVEVFNLEDDEEDEDLDEDEDADDMQNDDDDDDADDEDDDSDVGGDLGNLVKALDPKLRNKILKKNDMDSDDEDKINAKTKGLAAWGKKKQDYYDGDTGDLEIGQEFDDAEEEEEAAKEILKEKRSRMRAVDFFDTVGTDAIVDEAADAEDMQAFIKKNTSKSMKQRDKLIADLELVALGAGDQANVQIETINRDFTKLSTDQRLAMIKNDSPEVERLLEDLKDKSLELRERIAPLRKTLSEIHSQGDVDDDIVDYLQVKHQLLLSYCVNVVFYLYMKSLGLSVGNHPVMKQLLELRYCMEKMRPLDGKLKFQIDRLLNLKNMDPKDVQNLSLRPNLQHALSEDEEEEEEEENASGYEESKSSKRSKKNRNKGKKSKHGDSDDMPDDEDDETISLVSSRDSDEEDDEKEQKSRSKSSKSSGIYKAPKMTSMPYEDDETAQEKRERKLDLKRKKLRNSEILQSLTEEFSDNPENISSTGISLDTSAQKDLQAEEDERREFEEDRFIRLTLTRKEKQSLKRRREEGMRMENLENIGDIGEFEEINELAKQVNKKSGGSKMMSNDHDSDDGKAGGIIKSMSLPSAMQRTLNTFSQMKNATNDKSNRKQNDSDDMLVDMKPKSQKRRMAPSFEEDDGDMDTMPIKDKIARRKAPAAGEDSDAMDDNNLLEAFTKKKREFLAKKQEHYTAEPKYGGYEESISEGDKRAATYEMITNRGLTPHRSKVNRNARVKKRVKYDQAVIRRKGAVQAVRVGEAAAYGGERTGIKADLSRSRKF